MEMRYKTQRMVYVAMLTALQIILSRFLGIQTPIVRISFSFLPLMFCGCMFGPRYAALSGVAADILGTLLFSSGAYFPGFTLSAALTGMIYGSGFYKKPRRAGRLLSVVVLDGLMVSMALGALWLWMITGKGYVALLSVKAIQQCVMIPVKFLMAWYVVYRIPVRA